MVQVMTSYVKRHERDGFVDEQGQDLQRTSAKLWNRVCYQGRALECSHGGFPPEGQARLVNGFKVLKVWLTTRRAKPSWLIHLLAHPARFRVSVPERWFH